MDESTQHKLDRVRSPRVQITYDVETGGAEVLKELPFVVGVLSDLSGKPEEPLPKMMERKFVNIDRDNFNKVLSGIGPRLAFRVDNKLTDEEGQLSVELNFKHMDDFQPAAVARQVDPLKKLLDTRQRLSDLKSKMDGNDRLGELLDDVIKNDGSRDKLAGEMGVTADSGEPEGGGDAGGEEQPGGE